jgi:hypothetical protein
MTSRLFAAVLASVALLPNAAAGQESVDSRWLPWLGCWQAADEGQAPENLLVCVRPASATNGVEIATIADGEVVSTRTLVADGQLHDVRDEGCTGWQSASFSADGRRAFLHSELTCEGGAKRSASAIMAIGSPTEWLDAQSIGMDGERMPRVMRYRLAPESSAPEGFALTARRVAAAADARLLASAELSIADVQEAAPRVDPEALVAFLIERNQTFEIDAASVAELADAGVPNNVIDVLVAVSFPNRFVIDREARRMALRPQERGETRPGRRGYGGPFGWGGWGWDSWDYCYGAMWYSSLYCSPYSYGIGRRGWYDPYGVPIIIVRGSEPDGQGGRAVRGRGYTRGGRPADGSDGRTAQPRGGSSTQDRSSPSVRSSGGGSSSGSASPGGYRGGSSGSSSGTARPRGGR